MKNIVKRFFFVCLVAIMCVLILTACSEESNRQPSDNTTDDTIDNVDNVAGENNIHSESIDTGVLWVAYGYSNGVMLVGEGNGNPGYFINKNGERVFTLPNSAEKNYGLISADSKFVGKFLGKYCPINEYDLKSNTSSIVLLDESWNFIRPEDLGVTDFELGKDITMAMLADGYILAKRVEETYVQTSTELLVLDDTMNEIVNLSGIVEEEDLRHYQYLSGFLYKEDKIIDLRTGNVSTNLSDMYSKISLEHESDWWKYDSSYGAEYYYDIRDPEKSPVFSMNSYSETAYQHFNFSDGLAGIMFRTGEGGASWQYFFSIINEKGELLFEPVKLSDRAVVSSYDGVYAVATSSHLCLFDKTGKIAELQYQESFSIMNVGVTFSEDIIVLELSALSERSFHIYTSELRTLFD